MQLYISGSYQRRFFPIDTENFTPSNLQLVGFLYRSSPVCPNFHSSLPITPLLRMHASNLFMLAQMVFTDYRIQKSFLYSVHYILYLHQRFRVQHFSKQHYMPLAYYYRIFSLTYHLIYFSLILLLLHLFSP